jgi:hypothetical protein
VDGAVTRLAIVIATRGDVARAVGLALAARRRRLDVGVFAMHDAVAALATAPELVVALVEDGCEVIVCATSGDRDGVRIAELERLGATEGSQDDHAALVHRAQRVVAFA